MIDLTVTGVDNGSLLVASETGEQFRLAVDETLQARIRQVTTQQAGRGAKVAPREIQSHIRSGMSAVDVATMTGASLESVQRFEGPILAEREYIVESALNVPVHTALEPDPTQGASTFGSVIRSRLADLDAVDERWASWKEPSSDWTVKLSFTAAEIDHDARWKFEPKRQVLAPMNGEAHTLSQQGEMPGALIPRLRAVGGDERIHDSSRFDSGAFDLSSGRPDARDSSPHASAAQTGVLPFGRSTTSSPEATAAAVNRAPQTVAASSQTADLLEALRRRRGEREIATWGDAEDGTSEESLRSRSPGFVSSIDVPIDAFDDLDAYGDAGAVKESQASHNFTSLDPVDSSERSQNRFEPRHSGSRHTAPLTGESIPSSSSTSAPSSQPFTTQARGGRKGRAAMPSWDEIVFGAKSDDDLA